MQIRLISVLLMVLMICGCTDARPVDAVASAPADYAPVSTAPVDTQEPAELDISDIMKNERYILAAAQGSMTGDSYVKDLDDLERRSLVIIEGTVTKHRKSYLINLT